MTELAKQQFLSGTSCAGWTVAALAGDASTRSYDRLTDPNGESTILMDAGPDAAVTVPPFVAIAQHLIGLGLCAPKIIAQSVDRRFLLLSDLGKTDIARHLLRQPSEEITLYRAAIDVLLTLKSAPLPANSGDLSVLTPVVGATLLEPLFDWFAPNTPHSTRQQIEAAVAEGLTQNAGASDTLSLRDFHAENLIWRPDLNGTDRIGLLDFQDAFIAPAAYDLVSLLRDARRDVAEATRHDALTYFAAQSGQDLASLKAATAILGLQRNLRILGIFSRLAKRDGKAQYTALIPRVLGHIRADLGHPTAQPIARAISPLLDTTTA